MSSIKNFCLARYHYFMYNVKLKKCIRKHRQEVVKKFTLHEYGRSYWVECSKDYEYLPQLVVDDEELQGRLKSQAKIIMRDWRFFPANVQKDLFGIITYIAWLRQVCLNKKQHGYSHQGTVSAHIYEM